MQDDFSTFEANDPWVQTFIVNVDGLLLTFKVCWTLPCVIVYRMLNYQ